MLVVGVDGCPGGWIAAIWDTDRNECVECTGDDQCGASEPVCDPSSNECTLRCTGAEPDECSGSPDKSVCNATRGLCVECVDGSNTCSGGTCNG